MKLTFVEEVSKEDKKEIIKNSLKHLFDLWAFDVITLEEYKAIKEKCKNVINEK